MKVLMVATLMAFSSISHAEVLNVKIKGMVCGLCSEGVEKKLLKNPNVSSVKVNFDDFLVNIVTKSKGSPTDAELKKTLEDSGYMVDGIERKTCEKC